MLTASQIYRTAVAIEKKKNARRLSFVDFSIISAANSATCTLFKPPPGVLANSQNISVRPQKRRRRGRSEGTEGCATPRVRAYIVGVEEEGVMPEDMCRFVVYGKC